MGEIKMPFSMSKKFLISTGLRANPKAIKEFENRLREFATKLANEVAENTKSKNRKTIFLEDFDENAEDTYLCEESEEDSEDEDSCEESEEDSED